MKYFLLVSIGLSFATPLAWADPMTVGDSRLVGSTQSQCVAAATSAFTQIGVRASPGTNPSNKEPSAVFGTDKPYYSVVFCEGDMAFVAVSGPDQSRRQDFVRKIQSGLRSASVAGGNQPSWGAPGNPTGNGGTPGSYPGSGSYPMQQSPGYPAPQQIPSQQGSPYPSPAQYPSGNQGTGSPSSYPSPMPNPSNTPYPTPGR